MEDNHLLNKESQLLAETMANIYTHGNCRDSLAPDDFLGDEDVDVYLSKVDAVLEGEPESY